MRGVNVVAERLKLVPIGGMRTSDGRIGIRGWVAVLAWVGVSGADAVRGEDAREVGIAAVEGLRFEPVRMEARPGEALRIRVENADGTDLPHNWVLGKPGSLKKLVEDALALGGEGPGREFVPDVAEVLAATRLLEGGESEVLAVKVPEEAGVYPYVCTFPGHGYVMYGALYVGVAMPGEGEDPHIPSRAAPAELAGGWERPAVQRIFMPNSGPAAIAVALPDGQNYCWDAGSCGLRYAWEGEFIDAERHFRATGSALAKVLGKIYWRAEGVGDTLRIAGAETGGEAAARFLGYRLVAGRPRFEYEIGGVRVAEFLEELPDGKGLRRHFEIPDAPGEVRFFTGSERGLVRVEAGRVGSDGWVVLSREEAGRFSVVVVGK